MEKFKWLTMVMSCFGKRRGDGMHDKIVEYLI